MKNLFKKILLWITKWNTKKHPKSKLKYYDTLDKLPIGKWWNLLDTGNVLNLLKTDDIDIELSEYDKAVLQSIFDELIYTVNELDLSIEKLNARIKANELHYLLTGNNASFNEAKRLEYHLNLELKKKEQPNLDKIKINREKELTALEIYLKRAIDIWQVPTNRYYQYVNSYNEYIEKQNQTKK